MTQGLDELIEWLVAEVAYYGDGKLPLHRKYYDLHIVKGNVRPELSWKVDGATKKRTKTRRTIPRAHQFKSTSIAAHPRRNEKLMLTLIIGCPISDLFAALRRFQKYGNEDDGIDDPEEKAAALAALNGPLDETDMKIGRLAWKWMVETGDVSIGIDGEWNHLTFDEIMSVPEELAENPSNDPVKDSKGKQSVARPTADGMSKPSKPTKLPKFRPCVFIDEETVWRTLTGHGPDFKKIPNLEWRLLIVIAATKERGILQGDLVRATGQDKRSVPKRTDFLSLKGYIAKRTHMVRGTKTSKLWLTKFAPTLPAPSNPLGGLDMSAEALTKDMEPVSWKNQWVDNQNKDGKEEIAYMAFGQTIMAVIKAWGTVRIGDLKRKLGIMGRKWQMKVMSKFLRRFDAQGNISYVAAQIVGDSFVFKDCVRFEREPTPTDWSNLLATGKKHSQYAELRDKMPTKKLPKKSVRSKKKKGKGKGRPLALSRSNAPVLNPKNRAQPSLMDTNWVQEKPLANTIIEFVLTGAEEGYTAPEISEATVGSAFRRQIFAHMNSICAPDAQPSHLGEYQMSSQLKKFDQGKAHVFVASGTRKPKTTAQPHDAELIDPALEGNNLSRATSDDFGFGSVQASTFLDDGTSDLTILGRMEPGKPVKMKRPPLRRKLVDANVKENWAAALKTAGKADATTGEQSNAAYDGQVTNDNSETAKSDAQNQTEGTGASAEATVTRPTRKRKASQRVSYLDGYDGVTVGHQDAQNNDDGTPARKRRTAQKLGYAELAEDLEESSDYDSDYEQDRTNPGVYVSIPGSLNPDVHKKGRPRKSIVLIFRSDKIKDPNYLPGWTAYPRAPTPPPLPAKLISRPRKKPTQPIAAESGSSAPVPSQFQSQQLEQAEDKQSESHNGAPVPESSLVDKGTIRPQKLAAPIETEESPLQPSATATPNVFSSGEPSTVDTSTATVEQASKKASHAPKRDVNSKRRRTDGTNKWICDKCGGEWKNDIGLKYHLEKAKVPCNPFYAEHPELMVKVKAVKTRRAIFASPEPEAARPGTSSSSTSASSLHTIGKASRTQTKKTGSMANSTPSAPKVTEFIDPTNPRPVLKQRSILKSRHGVSGVVAPRGVQVSEAVAKETAAAKPTEDSLGAATPTDSMVNVPNRALSPEDGDAEEELPYLKQIRAEQARSSRRASSKPSATPAEDHGKPPQTHPDMSEDNRSTAVLSGSQFIEAGAVDQGSSIAANPASTMFDPYPTGVLEPAAPRPMANMQPHTDESGQATSLQQPQSSQAPQHATRPASSVPPFKRPRGDHIIHYKDCLPSEESALRAIRLSAIIEYLVDVNGGVFQTERVLHWAILKVYTTEFPGWPTPSLPGCSRAVGELVNQGRLRKDTMAVKTTRLWRMVTIIMRPSMNMNMKPVEDLRLVLKKVLPDMYIPPPFAPTESEKVLFREREKPVKPRTKGPGRRDHKLVEGIAQLTAPFYTEKGMAGIRANYRGSRARLLSDDDEDEPPVKRRKSRNADPASENGAVEFHPKRRRRRRHIGEGGPSNRRGQISLVDDYVVLEPHKLSIDGSHAANPGISSLPASFFSNAAALERNDVQAPTEVQFYAPNTHLEDDYIPSPEPEEEFQIDPRLLSESSGNEPTEECEKPTPPTINEASFLPSIVLHDVKGSKGTWPSVATKVFEKNISSFTMKGWMPTRIDILLDIMPKDMEQMAHKLTSHCKTEQWADPDYGDFCTSVDGCRSYELSDQGQRNLSGSIAPHFLYINFSSKPEVSNMAPCELRWDDENEWTLETIPYEMLMDDDYVRRPKAHEIIPLDPEYDGAGDVGRRFATSRSKLQEIARPTRKYIRKADRDPKIRELKVSRELTPYPQQKSDYFRANGEDSLGVDWKVEDTRIAAYVAVSTLMGGINKGMDWGLMMRIFPEAKLSNLRKFWSMIRKEREGFINSLCEKFQDEFLEAYQSGVLKPLDFNDPLAYGENWLEVVKWTLALVVKESIELPPTRQQFDAELELVSAESGDFDWRDMYHHWQRSVFNKLQDATSEPASTTLVTDQQASDNDIIVARSWIRALCCTDSQRYTPYEIRDKFLRLVRNGGRTTTGVNELLQSTILDLEHRRIAIKQKAQALSTGRPYKLNEHFARTLDRYSNEDRFIVAAEFKLKLDKAFRKGETVEIPWRTEDGMIIAAFNLQAHGRVRLEPIKKLDIPFGFKPGFYESRKFPKSYYRFEIKVTPTPSYLFNDEIEILKSATALDNVPGEAEDGKLPMWCDFFGQPHRNRWFKMLAGVMFVLSTRGAMTDQFATQALKPCFEEFEVEVIRKWGLKEGLLREVNAPGGAVTVTEWWWLVAGIPMLEMAENNIQDVVFGTSAGFTAGAATGAGAGTATGEAATTGRRSKDQYTQYPVGRSRRRGKYRMIH